MRLIKGAFSAQVGAALLNEHAAKLVASAKNKAIRNMSDSLSIGGGVLESMLPEKIKRHQGKELYD